MSTKAIGKLMNDDNQEDDLKVVKGKVRAAEDVIGYAETNKGEAPAKKKAAFFTAAPPEEKKKEEPKKKELPQNEKEAEVIKGFDRMTGKVVKMEFDKVTAISRYIYTHNIFDPTPIVEAVVYKAIGPGTLNVIMDIDEATFEDLRHSKKYKGKVFYNFVDGMMSNDPAKGNFLHRTFSVNYPEWIKKEDAEKQAKAIVSHHGAPNLSGIEKTLWPDFTGKIQKMSLSEDVKEEVEETEEAV